MNLKAFQCVVYQKYIYIWNHFLSARMRNRPQDSQMLNPHVEHCDAYRSPRHILFYAWTHLWNVYNIQYKVMLYWLLLPYVV